jgi:hypothetical protein
MYFEPGKSYGFMTHAPHDIGDVSDVVLHWHHKSTFVNPFQWKNTSRSFPHSWRITGFVTRLIRRVPLVDQELLTLPEHLISPPAFSAVRVTRSLVLRVWYSGIPFACPFIPSIICSTETSYWHEFFSKKSLKIPNRKSEAIFRRRKDNAILIKGKSAKGRTMVDKQWW